MGQYRDEDVIIEETWWAGYARQECWYVTYNDDETEHLKVGVGAYGYSPEGGGGYVYWIAPEHISAFTAQTEQAGHKCQIRPLEECETCVHDDIWYKRLIRRRYLPVKEEQMRLKATSDDANANAVSGN